METAIATSRPRPTLRLLPDPDTDPASLAEAMRSCPRDSPVLAVLPGTGTSHDPRRTHALADVVSALRADGRAADGVPAARAPDRMAADAEELLPGARVVILATGSPRSRAVARALARAVWDATGAAATLVHARPGPRPGAPIAATWAAPSGRGWRTGRDDRGSNRARTDRRDTRVAGASGASHRAA